MIKLLTCFSVFLLTSAIIAPIKFNNHYIANKTGEVEVVLRVHNNDIVTLESTSNGWTFYYHRDGSTQRYDEIGKTYYNSKTQSVELQNFDTQGKVKGVYMRIKVKAKPSKSNPNYADLEDVFKVGAKGTLYYGSFQSSIGDPYEVIEVN